MVGWVDNLESDLSNQAGPSGINIQSNVIEMTSVEEFQPEIDSEITEEKIEDKADQGEKKGKEEALTVSGDKKKDEENPAIVFAEHVTIAGLEEAFKEKWKPDRYMYRIALFLALIMIIYQSYAIVRQYQNVNTISTDMIVDKTAPFPNISICFPFTFNETTVLQQLREVVSDRDIKFMNRHNISLEKDSRDFYKSIVTLSLNASSLSSPIYLLLTKLSDKNQQKAIKEGKNLFLLLLPACSSILSNCIFNRISFDCCSKAKYLNILQQTCYQIDLSNITTTNIEKNETSSADPIRLNETGLSVDVNNNWNFGAWDEHGSASDGFYIFVDKIPIYTGDPTIIPSNMDATIILNQPVAVKEKSQCRANEEKSNLKLFDYYDSYGVHCRTEGYISPVFDNLGCQLLILSHILPDGCTLRQLTFVSLVTTQAIDDVNLPQHGTRFTKNESKKSNDVFKSTTYGTNSLCLPLCSRWSYKILSASYGSIKYQDKLEDEFKSSNQSWSRIRFVMPWTSIMEHKEEFVAKGYLAFCDIGGMMGVYAGFSIITFVQLAFYGGYWFSKRKKKQNTMQNFVFNRNLNAAVKRKRKQNKVFPAGQQDTEV